MTFKRSLNERYDVLADYAQWKGRWIHYSRTPYMKINPDPKHLDMAGIYFFPENFRTSGQWHKFPYKFVAEMPADLRILDFSKLKKDDIFGLLDKFQVPLVPEDRQKIEQAEFPKDVDIFWDKVRSRYQAARGKLNKVFRAAGYDAIFDDTDSVFSGETQLILLDPTKLKKFKLEEKKGSGYDIVRQILQTLETAAKKYSSRIEKHVPKKTWSGWDRENVILAKLRVDNQEYKLEGSNEGYKVASFEIRARQEADLSGRKFKDLHELRHTSLPVSKYEVYLRHSVPSLEQEWSIPRSVYVDVRDFKIEDVKNMAEKVLEKIFK